MHIKICILLVIFVNCRIGLTIWKENLLVVYWSSGGGSVSDCSKSGHAVVHRLNNLFIELVRCVVVRSVTVIVCWL